MSAFLVSDEQVSIILNGASEIGLISDIMLPDFGQLLINENIESVLFRYKNEKREDYAHEYAHDYSLKADIEQVYKFAKCFDYQACEHDGYKDSCAKKIIDHLCAKIEKETPNFSKENAMNKGSWSYNG
jgi:hypothetical protein